MVTLQNLPVHKREEVGLVCVFAGELNMKCNPIFSLPKELLIQFLLIAKERRVAFF